MRSRRREAAPSAGATRVHLDALTKVRHGGLYDEEPERPPNAVDYIKRYMGAPTGIDVDALRQENEDLKKEREELRSTDRRAEHAADAGRGGGGGDRSRVPSTPRFCNTRFLSGPRVDGVGRQGAASSVVVPVECGQHITGVVVPGLARELLDVTGRETADSVAGGVAGTSVVVGRRCARVASRVFVGPGSVGRVVVAGRRSE